MIVSMNQCHLNLVFTLLVLSLGAVGCDRSSAGRSGSPDGESPALVLEPVAPAAEGESAVVMLKQQPAVPLWDPAGLPDFSFVERSGREITRQDLLGQHWVAGFIFTRCAGPCPAVSGAMKQLQDRFRGQPLRLVTFTVDPKHDTVEVLKRYAAGYQADPAQWLFLTGDQREIYDLIAKHFLLTVQEDTSPGVMPGFEIAHSVSLMHINKRGVVVGKYNAQRPEEVAKLAQVLTRTLAAESSTDATASAMNATN